MLQVQDLESEYVPPEPTCGATEFSETNQVHVRSLYGLWIILAGAVLLAGLVAIAHYLVLRKVQPERKRAIDERMTPFRDSFKALRGVVKVPQAAEAFRKAGEARRQRAKGLSPTASLAGAVMTLSSGLPIACDDQCQAHVSTCVSVDQILLMVIAADPMAGLCASCRGVSD